MKPMHRSRVPSSLVVVLLLGTSISFAQSSPRDLFEQARMLDESNQHLTEAIALYQQVASLAGDERALAAQAQLRVGLLYDRMGQISNAERIYADVLDSFADQPVVAVEARVRLTALRQSTRVESTEAELDIVARQVFVDPLSTTQAFAPTPDGRQLVFTDWNTGNLAIRELETDEIRYLTDDASWGELTQYAWDAAVSPDGTSVAYLWAEENTSSLRLVNLDGANNRLLYREEGCPIFNPAWTLDSENVISMRGCGEAVDIVSLSVGVDVPAQTILSAEQVESASISLGDRISVSPDNRYATVEVGVEEEDSNQDIWIIDLDGGGATQLIQHPADDRLIGWLPETDDVLFLSDRDGRWDLWAVPVENGVAARSATLVRRNVGQTGVGGLNPLGFTENGSLFYSIQTRWSSLAVASLVPGTGIPDERSSISIRGSNLQSTWSPDGESVAFVSEQERTGAPGPSAYRRPLHIRNLRTGTERELAPNLHTRTPSWSPDGRYILTNGSDETDEREDYVGGLYRVDVESGEVIPVVELKAETQTSWWQGIYGVWTADSQAIIYSQYDGSQTVGRLIRHDIASGAERQLYEDTLLTTRLLALSPDGNRLVFGLRDSLSGSPTTLFNGGRLMMLELDTGAVQTVYHIDQPGQVTSLQWTIDGEAVLFSKLEFDDRRTTVWRVPIQTGKAEQFWTFAEGLWSGSYVVSPDGQKVAITRFTQEEEVWMMEGIREALGRPE